MRIQKCWFCSSNIYPGHGVSFVRNDGSVFRFCRTKCFKLFKRRVNPRKVKWTKICRQLRMKELLNDPIQGFERRIHRPKIYSRDTLTGTLMALPRVLDLKRQREDGYIKDRILAKYEEQKERDLKFIEKHEWLLRRDANQERETILKVSKKKEQEAELN